MSQPDLLTRLSAAIEAANLPAPQERVVVGVSGGPDSVALMHALTALVRTDRAGWKLHLAHLNHQLRGPEADADAEFVSRAARELGLPCTVGRADVAGRAAASAGRGLEETARQQRYRFLERVCTRHGARVLAVGHHADDNAETILHHIVRGTGLRGLRGMLPRRRLRPGSSIQLVRPLLGFRRAELVEFLEQRGIAYRRDRSNDSPDYTRNRIRRRVLPLLCEQINPQSVEALLRLGEQARWMEEFVAETAQGLLDALAVRRDQDTLVLSRRALAGRPRIVQLEVLRRAAGSFGLGERDLTFTHLIAVAELIEGRAGHGGVQLPGGLGARCEFDELVFSTRRNRAPSPPLPEVSVAVPGTTPVPGTPWLIDTQVGPVTAGGAGGPWRGRPDEEWMDYRCLSPPLVVRGLRPGDRFRPLGAPGGKKLADFFIDQKIPPRRRIRTPILCDRRGPLWVIPYRIDDRAKVTEKTRQLLKVVVRT